MAKKNVNVELTRKEQYYGSRKLTQEVRKLEERFDKSEDVRVPVIASVCLEVESLPGGANFATMTADEQIAFIKNNDSLFCANFDDLIELLATVAEGKTLFQKKKWAIEFLERQINVLDPLPGEPVVQHKKVNTGVAVLDSILTKIKRVNWRAFANEKSGEVSETNYILRTVERTLETASTASHPIVDKNGSIYCYTGTHYRVIEVSELRNFLIESAIRCGIPSDKAIYFVYARARLDGKLVNIASDVSKKISDEGLAKTLISREAVSARRPHKEGFNMKDYARLVFAMNELPPQFFSDAALAKRAAIIEFDQQVTPQKKDTDFAEKIIANELPGVLNWIIDGLTRLNAAGRLDAPPCCVEAMDKIRKENDPLAGWLGEKEYSVGNQDSIKVKDAYENFKEYCRENGNHAASKKTFTRRLRDVGYKIDRPNHDGGMFLYYSSSFLKNDADGADDAALLENKGEMPGTIPAQSA